MVDFRDLKNSDSHPDKPRETISPETDFEETEGGSDNMADRGSGADSKPKDLYKQAVLYVSRTFEAARRKEAIDLEPGVRFVRQLVEEQPNGDILFVMAIRPENSYPFIFAHCVNTAVFAVKMGAGLGFHLLLWLSVIKMAPQTKVLDIFGPSMVFRLLHLLTYLFKQILYQVYEKRNSLVFRYKSLTGSCMANNVVYISPL